MATTTDFVDSMVDEYRVLCGLCAEGDKSGGDLDISWDRVEEQLVSGGDWTPTGAQHVARLARDYGAFVLRNAMALALALRIEDGKTQL